MLKNNIFGYQIFAASVLDTVLKKVSSLRFWKVSWASFQLSLIVNCTVNLDFTSLTSTTEVTLILRWTSAMSLSPIGSGGTSF